MASKKTAKVKEPKAPKQLSDKEISKAVDKQREHPNDHGHHDLNAVGPEKHHTNKTEGHRTPGPSVTSQDGANSAQLDSERRALRKGVTKTVKLERDVNDDNGNPRVGPLTAEVPEDQVEFFVNRHDPKTKLSYGWKVA